MTCGLNNLGATCYMNATIQAIAHCPKLVNALMSSDDKCEVAAQLRILMMRMWKKSENSISPDGLLQALKGPMEKIGIHQMRDVHDANELYMVITDLLCESTTAALKQSLEGRIRWSTLCKKCGSSSFTPLEPFVTLNLDFTQKTAVHSLEDMIKSLFSSENIEGYQCDSASCQGRKEDASRTLQLWGLPTVLTIVLKRFVHDGSVNRSEVAIPGSLTICSSDKNITYNLCSVVCHSGHSQHGGHYVTASRHPGNGEWSMHDDDSTVLINQHQGYSNHVRRSAYMLFYEIA
jgi:ubiquitin carboxyl-terminal hydrolase 36/42